MIGDFYKAFRKSQKSRVLPPQVVEELDKTLPDGFHYVLNEETQRLIAVPINENEIPPLSTVIDPVKCGIPENLSPYQWMDYLYRTQKSVPIETYIQQGDKKFMAFSLYTDPIRGPESGEQFLQIMIPNEFPEAKPLVFELPNGKSEAIMIRRVPFEDMTHMKFGNVNFPALTIEWIVPDDPELVRSKKEPAQISVSAFPGRASSVKDAVFALQAFRSFKDGSLRIEGRKIGKNLDKPSGTDNEQVDKDISFWESALELEKLLHVHFQPGAEFPEEDRIFFSELLACLRDGKELTYKTPFFKFHIGIDKKNNEIPLESLEGPNTNALTFYREYPECTLLGSQFAIFETTMLLDVNINKVVKDEDGKGAEIYIRENSPWTLVKKYALTENEAENNMDLIFKKSATAANN